MAVFKFAPTGNMEMDRNFQNVQQAFEENNGPTTVTVNSNILVANNIDIVIVQGPITPTAIIITLPKKRTKQITILNANRGTSSITIKMPDNTTVSLAATQSKTYIPVSGVYYEI
jgi:hypothetical protein